eukprot:scaffold34698_cov173-Amphora_coffeaeformis.AAC.5
MSPTMMMEGSASMIRPNKRLLRNNFSNAKAQCLGKRDKSSAGRIDPHAVEICAVINEHDAFYTTSSCAGRCFLYRGQGIKATHQFQRFRVSHNRVKESERYFDLTTLESDPSGGGDPIRTIGQFEHAEKIREIHGEAATEAAEEEEEPIHNEMESKDSSIWLRFEPFILHVACRSLESASALMTAARPSFKNVGLTTWKEESRYLVAIWGDEGIEMPLTTPEGTPILSTRSEWLASLVNERHERNWNKIDRFVKAAREMPGNGVRVPRSFDVVGDVAVLHTLATTDPDERKQIGEAIMKKNGAIKVVVVRENTMGGTERAPGQNGFTTIAGATRSPLITTHNEHGIKCVVDLEQTFFSPRMGPERLRICQQVARGEHVLVLFAGVCMDAFQLAGRTEALSIVAVELNEVAIKCARLAHRMLGRNKAVKCVGAAERLEIIHGDVLDVVPTLPRNHYDRIVAPRPKEGALDGDLGTGEGGLTFLEAFLPVLKQDGGECHWYEFVADHEFPTCSRSRGLLTKACAQHGLDMEVLHVAAAGSVAVRQLRVCIDFRVSPQRED